MYEAFAEIPFEVVFLVMNPGYHEINLRKIVDNAALLEIPIERMRNSVQKQNIILEPLIHGGASTTHYRSGTQDTPVAAACAEALKLAVQKLPERTEHVRKLNQFLRENLLQNSRIRINSPEHAVPHILNISVNGIKGEEMRRWLSIRNVCISVKLACAVLNTPSRAVMALTHDRKNALSSWRISLSHLTTLEELEEFLFRLEQEIQIF